MSTAKDPKIVDPSLPRFLQALLHNRKQTGYVLLGLAAVFLLAAVYTVWKYQWDYAPVSAWALLIALSGLIGGASLAFGESEDYQTVGNPRIAVLLLGSLVGFATWLLSIALAWKWRNTLLGGTEAWQGESAWQLWVIALSMFVGLGITFFSLLLARAVERSNPLLRRLLYGFNAALSGLLLLAVLMVLNIFVYTFVTASYDWTESSIYTLSDRSRNILKALEKPTKIYVLMDTAASLQELKTLMENVREVNEKVQVEYLQPDRNRGQIEDLTRQYPKLSGRTGVLVVYGAEGDAAHEFIKTSDIFASDPEARRGAQARFLFRGEDALMTALNALQESKKPVVYFLQGNGELGLADRDASQPGQGAGTLKDRLEKANYTVKGLVLTAAGPTAAETPDVAVKAKVPDDASMVVVAGPRRPLPEAALRALREYMNPTDEKARKGKLVVMLDLVVDANGNLLRTGLEDLLNAFNVEVGAERIINVEPVAAQLGPLAILAVVNTRAANPVSSALGREMFVLQDVRPIRPRVIPGAPPVGMQADTFLQAPGLNLTVTSRGVLNQFLALEPNLRADPAQVARDLLAQAEKGDISQKASKTPVPVAVTVTEPGEASRPDDPHAGLPSRNARPRLAVFGTSGFISNANMSETRGSGVNYPLIQSTLAWLADKPASIGLEPKRRNIYQLETVTPEQESRMKWLPALIIYVGILGLATGVWIVRRR